MIRVKAQSIRIDVDFFDQEEREKLLRYPTAERISSIVDGGLQIPSAEFLTHLIWHRQRLGSQEYANRAALRNKLDVAQNLIDGCIVFSGGSIRMPPELKTQLTEVSEHVGEAVGLSVMDRIHDMTEADWKVLPVYGGRTAPPVFDFETASDGRRIVQLETKGSAAEDNRLLEAAVRAQKRRIADKKRKLGILGQVNQDPHPAAVRYGTITVLDRRADGNARCLLVDPDPEGLLLNPRAARLLSRVRFLRDWISFLSPRSQLAAALATRVADLEALDDPFLLNRVALLKGNGKPFEFETYDMFGRHASFFANRSRVSDGPAGGNLLQASDGTFFFAGIREQILRLASEQNFETLERYASPVGTEFKHVECIVSEGRYRQLNIPHEIEEMASHSRGYVRFSMQGNLNYSAGGLVFGFLRPS